MMSTSTPENIIDGTYVSDDEQFTLIITNSDYQTGNFTGTFTSINSPLGSITYNAILGRYNFVGTHHYPCQLGFSVNVRHSPDWTYDQSDYWCGSRTSDGSLLMSGSRAYVNGEGVYQVFSFDQVKFKQIA